jgi:hypothetical protein
VITDDPTTPWIVAVTVAVPGVTALASPEALTATIPLFVLAHVTACPEITLPLELFAVAVNCTVTPTAARVAVGGDTSTVTTFGWETVTTADPATPETVAVIAAFPTLTAVTSPAALTVATAAFELAHVAVLPETVFPEASLAVAVSCAVAPMASSVAEAGVTVTDVTVGPTGSVGPSSPGQAARKTAAARVAARSQFMERMGRYGEGSGSGKL